MPSGPAAIETVDIGGYIRDRLEVVAPATLVCELDVLWAIFSVASKVWQYRVADDPMINSR